MSDMQGKFVWYDLMTSDTAAAASFYGEAIGWEAKDAGMPGPPYTLLSMGSRMVGGVMGIPEEARARGAGPSWMGHIGVDDVDAMAERVTEAGGAITRAPQEIPGVGRFAVAADPHGATFLMFQPKGTAQEPPANWGELGVIGWNELHAGDLESDFAFYAGLFGWKKENAIDMGPLGMYQTFGTGAAGGGMMTKAAQAPVPFWLFYINVESVDAAVERVKKQGGQLVMGPHQVPGGSWIVSCLDPQGATFAMVSVGR